MIDISSKRKHGYNETEPAENIRKPISSESGKCGEEEFGGGERIRTAASRFCRPLP
jgi:hypothetical protein